MTDKISKRNWETISAYLDGELSPRKQARFETRLNRDSHLQSAFDQMHHTRQILRSTPLVRAPRNFTITPEMAGQSHRLPRLAPVFGWASAVASLLLILILVGDFFIVDPFPNNVLQQDEFIAPRGQAIEEAVSLQPSVAGGASEPMLQVAEEAAAPEVLEEQVTLEVAAEPVLESVLDQETVTASKEVEVFAAAEEDVPEKPDTMASGAVAFESTSEKATEEALVGSEAREREGEADSLVEGAFISETLDTEGIQEQPVEEQLVEESETRTQPEQVEQSSNEVARALPAGELTQVWAMSATETPSDEAPIPEKTSDVVLGIEVLLGLLAVGTGLVWLFMRHRGG